MFGAECEIKFLSAAVVLIVAAAMPVEAANFVWLNNAPIRFFTDADLEMMEKKADEVLNEGLDGQEYSWANPETGNSGSFVAQPLENRDERGCRRLTIVNRARTTRNTSQFTYCRQEDGEWRITR